MSFKLLPLKNLFIIDLFLEINDAFKLKIISNLFRTHVVSDYYISQCIVKYSNLSFNIFSKLISQIIKTKIKDIYQCKTVKYLISGIKLFKSFKLINGEYKLIKNKEILIQIKNILIEINKKQNFSKLNKLMSSNELDELCLLMYQTECIFKDNIPLMYERHSFKYCNNDKCIGIKSTFNNGFPIVKCDDCVNVDKHINYYLNYQKKLDFFINIIFIFIRITNLKKEIFF